MNERMEKNQQKIESLIELAALLNQQVDYQEILRVVTHQASTMLKGDIALIMMINPQTNQTVKTIYSLGNKSDEQIYQFIHSNISGWVIKNRSSLCSTEVRKDDRFNKAIFKNAQIESVLCVPLWTEGMIIGTIMLLNQTIAKIFSKDDLFYLEKFANIVTPFLRNVQKIQQFFNRSLSVDSLLHKYETLGLLGKSQKFINLLKSIDSAAQSHVRVLLEGQSGTGKERIAKAIHQLSSRSENQFFALDCGTMPANLIESELFGHVKGSFTGATTDRKGLISEAEGGTLFLDEISSLPLELQGKLLRLLQEGEIRPLGSNKIIKVDVRIISASSNSLIDLVRKKQFREDLFYRLHVYPIVVPPLDQRREDIMLLMNHFLQNFVKQQNKRIERFHKKIINFCEQRTWAGNIRELENFVERMVTLASGNDKIIDLDILPEDFRTEMLHFLAGKNNLDDRVSLNKQVAEFEANIILQVLNENEWNQSKAARKLNISEQTIRYKINKYHIIKPE